MRFKMYVLPSLALYSRRTVLALMVMPRSRSMSIESSTCSTMSRSATVPVCWISRSASVDLPWSIWATMAKLRILSIGWAVMGSGDSRENEGRERISARRNFLRQPPLAVPGSSFFPKRFQIIEPVRPEREHDVQPRAHLRERTRIEVVDPLAATLLRAHEADGAQQREMLGYGRTGDRHPLAEL